MTQLLFLLILLACPVSMMFMMRGMGGMHGGHGGHVPGPQGTGIDTTASEARIAGLEREVASLREGISARADDPAPVAR